MGRRDMVDDPELALARRRAEPAPDFGLFAPPAVAEATAERDAILERAEEEQAEWVRRAREAMVTLYHKREIMATADLPAYVTAADLADWCDAAGYPHDRRKLAPVFVGKGAEWVCVGRVPNPRRHSSLTPCWALREGR